MDGPEAGDAGVRASRGDDAARLCVRGRDLSAAPPR
jgi:hypothetical protein